MSFDKQIASRRALGQVFTPRAVADWMTAWACAHGPRSILDPALGPGVFVDAAASYFAFRGFPDRPSVDAYDVDAAMIRSFCAPAELGVVTCRCEDFLTAELPRAYEAILANPPYVRHHAHRYGESVFGRFDRLCGRRLSRLTNVYGLFLLRIWEALAPSGRAAVITPAEWLNADFGAPIKAFLLERNGLDGIVQFPHASKVFQDVMTTAAITLLRRGRGDDEPVQLATVETAGGPDDRLLERAPGVPRSVLDPKRKWTPLFEARGQGSTSLGGGRSRHRSVRPVADAITLGSLARCVRGIATGANQYFTLRESDRMRHGLDRADFSICVTKAQSAIGSVFSLDDVERLIKADQRIYLLSPREPLSEPVQAYLDWGKSLGIHRRYLPAHRPVWFRPEHRPAAPIWVSVFARGRFRFVRNEAAALNLTAFHGLYPRTDAAALMERLFEYLTSDAAQDALSCHRRIYAEGLLKLEPRDVEAIEVPRTLFGASQFPVTALRNSSMRGP
ncbi:MAG: N-6 DNA methylase [Phycisphaerae bacterium]|nr:N-6 DNA methylase [Phycisphaerae bacterium]